MKRVTIKKKAVIATAPAPEQNLIMENGSAPTYAQFFTAMEPGHSIFDTANDLPKLQRTMTAAAAGISKIHGRDWKFTSQVQRDKGGVRVWRKS